MATVHCIPLSHYKYPFIAPKFPHWRPNFPAKPAKLFPLSPPQLNKWAGAKTSRKGDVFFFAPPHPHKATLCSPFPRRKERIDERRGYDSGRPLSEKPLTRVFLMVHVKDTGIWVFWVLGIFFWVVGYFVWNILIKEVCFDRIPDKRFRYSQKWSFKNKAVIKKICPGNVYFDLRKFFLV